MITRAVCGGLIALMVFPAAWGQVSTNQSLTGKYFFRHTMLTADASGNVTDSRSAWGSMTFDGNGGYTFTAQQIVAANAAAPLSGSGTYTVKAGGFVTLANPQKSGVQLNARLGPQALAGASTETAALYDLFVAIPASAQTMSAASLNGIYYVSTLEFPNGSSGQARDAFFSMAANGNGSFGSPNVTGNAQNLNNQLASQLVVGVTYTVAGDGSGTLTFPLPSGIDPTTQLVSGAKAIYVAQDGSYFIGGSAANGGHGFLVGVKAFASNATNMSWSGLYWGAGLRFSAGQFSAYTGSVNSTGQGNAVWYRRVRQPAGTLDFTPLHTYSLKPDGSGAALGAGISVASTGNAFAGSGVTGGNSAVYELYFGFRMPSQSGTGVFLNPQGIYNAASFAPAGTPVSPGEFLTIYGSGFTAQAATGAVPYQTTLGGVQVLVNNQPAPLYYVSATSIDMVVPFSATGSTATFVVSASGGTRSNTVDIPLAGTSPGVFSLNQNGIGPAAVLHPDYSVVSATNGARPGEVVQVYLTGMGAVNPAVRDGAGAPTAQPLALISGPVAAYVGGVPATVAFQGLAPGFAGLYQLNVQIPQNVPPSLTSNSVPLAIQTADGFTDLVDIAIGLNP